MILCSRAKCNCLAGALLIAHPTNNDIAEFVKSESIKGRIVRWEDRKSVWCERCFKHELRYMITHPSYIPIKIKQTINGEFEQLKRG